jgi:hypothetical protein
MQKKRFVFRYPKIFAIFAGECFVIHKSVRKDHEEIVVIAADSDCH